MTEDERRSRRSAAQREYRKTERGIARTKKYQSSDKAKKVAKRFRQSEGGKGHNKSPNGRYHTHKAGAKRRGVEWLFTFDTWWAIWEPHWESRGQGSNDLQMCRYGDKGPYSPDNVRIDTCANNVKEMFELRRAQQ